MAAGVHHEDAMPPLGHGAGEVQAAAGTAGGGGAGAHAGEGHHGAALLGLADGVVLALREIQIVEAVA
jgi:hypothetical protein